MTSSLTRIDATASTGEVTAGEFITTSGVLALINLQAQIDSGKRQPRDAQLDVSSQAEFVDLVGLRGQILGRIADYEWAEELAEELTNDAPGSGLAFLARARTRARFHRFAEALNDLDEAQRLGADAPAVDAERAATFQATGRYEEALALQRRAVKQRADLNSLGAMATLYAEREEIGTAERLFDESRRRYRGVSPFPLALLDFQRGAMWLARGNFRQARLWLDAAHRRLPCYAAADGHLAEVAAALASTSDNGRPLETALSRLRMLAITSDDPDYAASLARILREAGRVEEALEWRAKAAARYDELIVRHPAAFADHAAEFCLEAGDPQRALRLAKRNFEVRQTPRARELLMRATQASEGPRSSP